MALSSRNLARRITAALGSLSDIQISREMCSGEGGKRALIEAVRIADSHQGQGLGRAMMNYVIDIAHEKKCKIVQLTSNNQRSDAIRFYEQLGFQATHAGFKLYL